MINDTDQPLPDDRAIFLDRDGTIIDYVPYLSDPEQVRLIPGAGESLSAFASAGYRLVLITNQSGIGRGYYSEKDFEAVNARMAELLAGYDVVLDHIDFCPHTPENNCLCRKPATGMGESAAAKLGISLTSSFMIGDNRSDIEFGRAINATTVLVETGLGKEQRKNCADICDYVVPSIKDAVTIVLGEK